jgi:hypothetical protein
MPRNIRYWAALAAAAAALARAGWPAAPSTVTTVINRVDVVVVTLLLAGLPVLARRVVGPRGASRAARILRAGGYAAVFALVAVKAEVARSAGPRPAGGAAVAGVVAGEIVFLAVVAVYLGWLLAATSRRPVASPAALATGTAAGAAAGVLMFLLPPRGGLLHLHASWQADLYRAGQLLAILLALATGIAAGVLTARRTVRRDRAGSGAGQLPLAEARARQGLAAGLCAGMTAALVASVLHTGTVALLPHQVQPLHWMFSAADRRPVTVKSVTENLYQLEPPNGLIEFEMSLADTAAGYLLVLVFFPLLGAGLGAWGALYTAGRPGQQPGNGGGGGGGGGGEPKPAAPPPDGGRRADEDRRPSILRGYLKDLPAGHGLPAWPGGGRRAAERPTQIPAGLRGPPRPGWPDASAGRSP